LKEKFDENRFQTVGDVLRVYFFSFELKKGAQASLILNGLAENVIHIWTEFYQPTIPKRSVVRKIRVLVEKYKHLRTNKISNKNATKNCIA
jgi:hypothetical protein